MGCGPFKGEDIPPQSTNSLMCQGCEKAVELQEQLTPYIGKMYCPTCIKAIKENNRRTMGGFNKQIPSIQQSTPDTASIPSAKVEEQQ